MQMLSF
jgi:hypothetical protein